MGNLKTKISESKIFKTVKDNKYIQKSIKDIQSTKAYKDIQNTKKYKEKILEIFEGKSGEKLPSYSTLGAEKEIERMKKYLEDEIKRIDDCLNFMEEIGKKQENSGAFNNLSVLAKEIEKAIKTRDSGEFCSRLSHLSDIGNIICKKILNQTGNPSGKKLALNSNLRSFDKQAKKWSDGLLAWIGRVKIEVK